MSGRKRKRESRGDDRGAFHVKRCALAVSKGEGRRSLFHVKHRWFGHQASFGTVRRFTWNAAGNEGQIGAGSRLGGRLFDRSKR